MTGVKELTGGTLDSDCLHCYLPPLIAQWMDQHEHVSDEQLMIQVAQTLGELVGSLAPDPTCADRMAMGLLRFVRQSARDVALAPKSVEPS